MRTTLFQRAAAVATTLGLTSLGLLGAGAAPAQAATSDCPKGYLCAWANGDGTGPMFKTKTSMPTLGSWDNKILTRYNRTGLNVCLFDEQNYAGGYSWDTPAESYPINGGNAEISSIKIAPTLRDCESDPYPYWATATSPRAGGFGDMNGVRPGSRARVPLMPSEQEHPVVADREGERICDRQVADADYPCLLYTSPSPRDS